VRDNRAKQLPEMALLHGRHAWSRGGIRLDPKGG
jgi:hypothetical protein